MLRKIVVFCVVLLFSASIWSGKPDLNYVMHKVVSGESLYKIGQKNNVTVDEILKSNPGITAAGLKPGMILRIPIKNVPLKTTVKPELSSKKQQNHIVLPKETLYSISKVYSVTVEDIKIWNDLKDASIKEGMVLVIYPNQPAGVKTEMTPKNDVKNPIPEKTTGIPTQKPVKEMESQAKEELPADKQPEEKLTPASLSKQFIIQQKSGIAQTIKGTADLMSSSSTQSGSTYFAMHKTASIGTILKIKNLENNKVTYAKVIGKLPELDENKNVMVRVSMGVAKALQMGYGKAYVEMNYAQ